MPGMRVGTVMSAQLAAEVVVREFLRAHPYETVAFELCPLAGLER
jgi:hypothetical protein